MRKQLYLWLRVGMGLALVIILLLAGCAAPAKLSPAPVAAPSHETVSSPASAPGGAPQEGIKVHGHWMIEVKNPDGTLVERREFENALMENGAIALGKILARQGSVGGWAIDLNTGGQPMPGNQSPFDGFWPGDGYIVESSSNSTAANYYKTLTVTQPTSGNDTGKLVLSGTATVSLMVQ